MEKVFSIYFKHTSIRALWLVDLTALLALLYRNDFSKWWWLVFVLLLTPFYEWVIHKYYLHADMSWLPKPLYDFWEKVHPGHHKDPTNVPLIFAPFIIAIQVPLPFFFLARIFLGSWDAALMIYFVTGTYYLFYEWMHLAHHTESYIPRTQWGKDLKRNHQLHHFKNERYWWGITNMFGDNLLGSNPPPAQIPFSVTVKNISKYHNLDSDMGH